MTQPHPLAPRQSRPASFPPEIAAQLSAAMQQRASVAPGYESMSRYASGPAYDGGLLARHEHLTRQRQAGAPLTERERNRRLLELRRRQLTLADLG